MVRSMLSLSPSERPEAVEITGTPLFQELELPCRLAMRQRSRTYSASSMGRPSRQTSTTWRTWTQHISPFPWCPCFLVIPCWSAAQEKHLSPLPSHTASDRITLDAKYPKCAGIYLWGFRAVRQSPACLLSLANTHAVTCSYTITLPKLLLSHTYKWRIF